MGESRESYLRRREQNHGKSYQRSKTWHKAIRRMKDANARNVPLLKHLHQYAKSKSESNKDTTGLSIADRRKLLNMNDNNVEE